MYTKKLSIKSIENARILISQSLNVLYIIVEEKIGIEWALMLKHEHKIKLETATIEFISDAIKDILVEYAEKKQIEEKMGEIISEEGFDYIDID